MPTILDHFDILTDQGLKVIPLRENSKIPMCKGWTENWSKFQSRQVLQKFPLANIGILLGDIVDVEGDSDEANEIILNLIGDYPHPTYRSSKSIHHLFLTPDDSLKHFEWNKIEFRGHGHQSVLPPSQALGNKYAWRAACKFPVPDMPEELVAFFNNKRKSKNKNKSVKPGHIKTACDTCEKQVFLHKKRFYLELAAFKILNLKWTCNKCRHVDLRSTCRLLRAGVELNQVID